MSETETTDTKDAEPVTEQHTEPVKKPAAQRAAEQATMEMNEEVVARFKEMERNFAEQAKQLVKLAEENATLRQDVRSKEFTDEVKGRADDNRNPWIGSHEDHISMLSDLAEQFGKDSKQVRQYVQINRAQAEFARTSNIFKQIGTGRGGENTIEAKVEAAAKALMEADRSLTRQKAIARVYQEQPQLYEEQQRASAGR